MRNLIYIVALALLACGDTPSPEAAQPAGTAESPRVINIKVSGGEYQPSSVKVRKGETVRLAITRDEKPTCGDEFLIPAMNVREKVEVNKLTTVDVTPQGDLEWTCGMNMMKGKIVVQE